ncbi:MAG: hypothetical protein AAF214_02145 [Pseudomonadota bacterium]
MQSTHETADDVAEYLLERTGNALLAGNFDEFSDCFRLPYELETLEGFRTLATPGDMQTTFDAVRGHLVQKQVTLMARHCVSASYRSINEVASTHETRLISRGVLIQQPYPTFSILRRCDDGQWRITSSSYVIVDSEPLNQALATRNQPSKRIAT